MTNDLFIFAEHFRTGFPGQPSGTLPADQAGLGDELSMAVKDKRTPVQVAPCSGRRPPTTSPSPLPHRKAHEQNAVVTVPSIDISQVLRRAAALTVTDLLRVSLQDITQRQMIDRGIAAQAIYGDFLQELSHSNHLYSRPLSGDSQPRSPSRTPTRNPR